MFLDILAWAIAWVFPILFFACIIPAFYYNDSKKYGSSTFFMITSTVLAGIYFKNDISTMLGTHSLALTVAFLAGAYIAAGFVTSFVYFIFFNWKAKERYEELLDTQDLPTWARNLASSTSDFSDDLKLSIRKYMLIVSRANQKYIFQDTYGNLNINVNDLGMQDKRQDNMGADEKLRFREMILPEALDKVVSDVLPPRFKTCKPFIIGAGCSWPITIIWLLISRVIKQIIERLVSTFGGTFDKISVLAFGKF